MRERPHLDALEFDALIKRVAREVEESHYDGIADWVRETGQLPPKKSLFDQICGATLVVANVSELTVEKRQLEDALADAKEEVRGLASYVQDIREVALEVGGCDHTMDAMGIIRQLAAQRDALTPPPGPPLM